MLTEQQKNQVQQALKRGMLILAKIKSTQKQMPMMKPLNEKPSAPDSKITDQEHRRNIDIFTYSIKKSYALKRGSRYKVNPVVLKDAIASGHPEAIHLEWSLLEEGCWRQGLNKEEIDFAKKEFYDKRGYNDNGRPKEPDTTNVEEAGPDNGKAQEQVDADYEALERKALQEEQRITDAEIWNFLTGGTKKPRWFI